MQIRKFTTKVKKTLVWFMSTIKGLVLSENGSLAQGRR